MNLRQFTAASMVLLVYAIGGCAPQQAYRDPIGVMLDRQAGLSRRRFAMEQARSQMPRDPRRIKALQDLLWKPKYPAFQRQHAIDELIIYDERAFRDSLPRRFGLLRNWDTINHIFDHAVERNWTDFTVVAVDNYARRAHGIGDLERPERRVIEKLNPGKTVEQVIFEVFANADDRKTYKQQVAAWELICRLQRSDVLIDLLDEAANTTPLVIDLKAGAEQLHVLPRNREGVLWLQAIRQSPYEAFWESAVEMVGRLNVEQKTGLQLRHLPILLILEPSDIEKSRSDLVRQVDVWTHATRRYLTGPTYDGPMRDWPQEFDKWSGQLCWADLASINVIRRAVQDRVVAAALFAHADRDLQDVSTEYGGVLKITDGRFTAERYEPRFRDHDLKFIASDKMITDMYTNAAHYHFHAQRYKNARYAGPGEGDIRLAERIHANYLVFTFIDRDHLNVDYYQHGRIVIDLGTIAR